MDHRPGKYLVFAIATVVLIGVLTAAGLPTYAVDKSGQVTLGATQIWLVLSETGNKPTAQDVKTVKVESGYPSEADGLWTLKGTLTVGTSKKSFAFTQRVKKNEDHLEMDWHVEGLGSEIIDARIALRMPGKEFEGKAVVISGSPVALPLEPDTFMMVPDQQMSSLALPGKGGDLLISGEAFTAFIQDRRKMGNDWFEARVQLKREGAIASGKLLLKAIPAGSAIVEKGPDGPPAWQRYPKFDIQKDIPYLGPERKEALDLYIPQTPLQSDRFPAVLVIHGGGWSGGDKADAREKQIAETLARAGFVAASVNYLLSTKEAPSWPTNIHDVKTAIRFLRANAAKYKIAPDKFGTIGGSAGGHLSMLMGWTGDEPRLDPPAFPGVSTRIHAIVDLYGVPDVRLPLSKGTRGCGEGWTGLKMSEHPALFELLSPITHVTNDGAPVLILHGTLDTTVPIGQTEALVKVLEARKARYQYKVVPDAPHTFLISSKYGDFREMIVNFFREHLR